MFISALRGALTPILPSGYLALTEQHVSLIESEHVRSKQVIPDVAVIRDPFWRGSNADSSDQTVSAAFEVSLIEPVTLPLPADNDDFHEAWIEIRSASDDALISVIEILSPWNKPSGMGRGEYLTKRLRRITERINLIEIDLLLGGARLPMGRPLPPEDYFAFISRSDFRPNAEVYAWKLRDMLPVIPIPLRSPDPDIQIDLKAIFTTT